MPQYALKIGYIPDVNYSGFNHQLHDITNIFTLVCKALKRAQLLKSIEKVMFASRTDRGVGALCQVVSFNSPMVPILPEINSYLASGIRVLGQTRVVDDFNPRKDALLRTYSYFLVTSQRFDIEKMEKSFKLIQGTHNFQNFAKTDSNKSINPIKTITEARILKRTEKILQLRISSRSFLWQQVRRIIGHLVEVATTDMAVSTTNSLLDNRFSGPKPPSALPEGLILERIEYKDLSFNYDEKSINGFRNTLSDISRRFYGQLSVNEFFLESIPKV
jgi:tRNA pseudouridine38-40 synthase